MMLQIKILKKVLPSIANHMRLERQSSWATCRRPLLVEFLCRTYMHEEVRVQNTCHCYYIFCSLLPEREWQLHLRQQLSKSTQRHSTGNITKVSCGRGGSSLKHLKSTVAWILMPFTNTERGASCDSCQLEEVKCWFISPPPKYSLLPIRAMTEKKSPDSANFNDRKNRIYSLTLPPPKKSITYH